MPSQEEFLWKAVQAGKLAHAYLFAGNDAAAKRQTAQIIIQRLNCAEKSGPCLVCRNCLDIKNLSFPDLAWVFPEEKEIQIGQIRQLAKALSFAPYMAERKYAVIEQAHAMNAQAQSAFLKLLEEPKGSALILLFCEYPALLLDTIQSRTQVISFFRFGDNALSQDATETFLHLHSAPFAERFAFAKKTAEAKRVPDVLEQWELAARARLLWQVQDNGSVEEIQKARKILGLIGEMRVDVAKTTVSARFALEQVLIAL
ncbi:MAG: DNA polymerase III subunit [Candidatus Yanofskybacteria bacterium]|nr:DNA polymerase III subunit [Candidatus Yanofskybacteria bacterium]